MKAGDSYGQWTVKEVLGPKWTGRALCQCTCGTERTVLNINLLNGKSKSCGCYAKEVARKNGLKGQRSIEITESVKFNSTGYKGVVEVGNWYQVRLSVGGFKDPAKAHEVYVKLKEYARELQDGALSE